MDALLPAARSKVMARVRSKHTRPELMVRRLTHAMGYRYRLHGNDLPGRPDLVFRSAKKVIFVNGCFWHRHNACALARLPKSRVEFWLPKLEKNRVRDIRNRRALARRGWKVLTVWECQLKDIDRLRTRIERFLDA